MWPLPSTPEQNPTPSGFEPRSVGTRPAPGAVANVKGIRRKIEDELGAQPYEHIHAICGAEFVDD
jgi:hypothetical protein